MNFPCKVYDVTATSVIGIAYNISDVLTILSNDSGWQYMGTPYDGGNNTVLWFPKGGGTAATIPAVQTDPNVTNQDVTGNTQYYQLNVTDVFSGKQLTNFEFPMSIFVNYRGISTNIGNFNNPTEVVNGVNAFIQALNSPPTSNVTVSQANFETTLALVIANSLGSSPVNITLTADAQSSQFIAYAGNTQQNSMGVNAVYGIDLSSDAVLGTLGVVSGTPSGYFNQSIMVGNKMFIADGSTGYLYGYDMTNPMQPYQYLQIKLTNVTGTNFEGSPHYNNLPWFWSLYLCADTYTPTEIYAVESLSGTIWKVNINTGALVGSAFQDNQLIGKKPFCVINGLMYFTQDGNLETGTGQSSGVAEGDIVTFDTTRFDSSSIGTTTISESYVLSGAINYDGTIFFLDSAGNVIYYNVYGKYSTASLGTIFPATTTFVNISLNGQLIYASSQNWGTQSFNLTTGEVVIFEALHLPAGNNPNTSHCNFTITTTDMGILTFTNGTYGAGLAKYTITGQFVDLIFGSFNFYNVQLLPKPKSTVTNLQQLS